MPSAHRVLLQRDCIDATLELAVMHPIRHVQLEELINISSNCQTEHAGRRMETCSAAVVNVCRDVARCDDESALAMRGAPATSDSGTRRTSESHDAAVNALSPAALDSAIRLLDQPAVLQSFETIGDGDGLRKKING